MSSPLPKMHFRGSGRSSSLINVPSASNYQPNSGQGVTMLGNTIISNENRNHPMREKISQAGRNSLSNYQQQPQQAKDSSPYTFMNQQQHPGLAYDHTLPGNYNHQVLSPIPLSHSNPLLAPRASIVNPMLMPDPNLQPAGYNPQSKITPIAFNLGYQPAPGSQHYYGAPIIVKGRKEKEEKKDKKKKKEEKNVDIKPLESLLGQYLDRQNQLMARIFRDIEDDKKRENLKQAYYNNSPDFGHGNHSNSDSPSRRNLANSPGKHSRSSSLIPLKNPISSQTKLTQEDDLSPNPFIRRRLDGLNTDIQHKLLRKDFENKNQFLRKPNRVRGKKLLKQFTWGLALPSLWFLSVVKWSEQRRESELKVLRDEIPEHLETFLEFAAIGIEKEIKSFVTDKNSMVLVQPFTPKSAELDRRCKTISEHLILILDHLSLKMDSGKLPPSFFEFLAALSEDDAVLPDNFLSGFEISRLTFNMFGNLKNMEEWKSKMILACFLLIKGVLYFLMLRPWTVIPSVLEKQVNFKNILNAGSVLYHITLDALSEYTLESKSFMSQEAPFEAAPPTFSALEANKLQKLDILPESNEDDTNEVISGFYSREKLSEFLDERPKMVKEVRASVLDFLDVLYDLTHNALEPKWHVKRMFADFRPKK